MNKKRNIRLSPILLLLMYVISVSPAVLFHHHENHVAAYGNATPCEKTIYYGDKSKNCGHKTHISTQKEKCSLCDHYTDVHDTLKLIYFCVHGKRCFVPKYNDFQPAFLSFHSIFAANKGPPIV